MEEHSPRLWVVEERHLLVTYKLEKEKKCFEQTLASLLHTVQTTLLVPNELLDQTAKDVMESI